MKAEERDKTVKITFISNFLGPHQLPFCKAMVNRLGEDFKFVATEPMTEERIKLGWSLDKDTYPFEIKANESNELQKKAEQLAIESDVVIIGSAPDSYIIPRLKRNKLTFKMTLIGTGEMEEQLHNMIRDKSLEDCVEMPGAMKASEVRSYMEKADIYLFTSDFNEGWGAVLNESMNSGCAVVASHAIGSVPFLIKDEENGPIYENGNQKQLEQQVCRLMDDAEYRMKLGLNAYHTIADLWNADVAAERLIDLCENIIFAKKTKSPYENGICSEAKVMENDWFGK